LHMTTPSYFLKKKKKILNLYGNANMHVPSKIVRNVIIVLFTCIANEVRYIRISFNSS